MAQVAPPWVFKHLTKLHEQEPELVDTAVVQLIQGDNELRWSLVVSAYLDQEISLAKAAELLGMHALELRDRFIELGIALYIGPANFAEAQAEVEAVRSWFSEPNTVKSTKG
jgi:predicted HTH domain antitoxin